VRFAGSGNKGGKFEKIGKRMGVCFSDRADVDPKEREYLRLSKQLKEVQRRIRLYLPKVERGDKHAAQKLVELRGRHEALLHRIMELRGNQSSPIRIRNSSTEKNTLEANRDTKPLDDNKLKIYHVPRLPLTGLSPSSNYSAHSVHLPSTGLSPSPNYSPQSQKGNKLKRPTRRQRRNSDASKAQIIRFRRKKRKEEQLEKRRAEFERLIRESRAESMEISSKAISQIQEISKSPSQNLDEINTKRQWKRRGSGAVISISHRSQSNTPSLSPGRRSRSRARSMSLSLGARSERRLPVSRPQSNHTPQTSKADLIKERKRKEREAHYESLKKAFHERLLDSKSQQKLIARKRKLDRQRGIV